ncbi:MULTISPECIES: carbohydrate ABC transporter permease [unclassified Paenibacillus]|uniref:carbohydrate ABC transporter permease n=1 Tax=unclassified Paenibacillus TaxID=185978 RepID=UPI001C11726E|nr:MULTISPECIES: carbohydrate ABC transporter permease [unclassified Paenibacillus]MBU5444503.1 carbohydrate ABC transporter permease [Paenibacillus sp. MSJ-34]CAH0122326.1 L-arabinose transport system permease protein AraQ [Paenibacillus sp. CECT 9249]
MGKIQMNKIAITVLFYAVSIAVGAAMFLPFLWSLLTSVKPSEEIFSLPIKWIPSTLTWEHYIAAFTTVPFGLFFWNSLVLAVAGVVANLFFGSLSGYAFAKLRFKLNKPLFMILLAAMMIPGVVTMIPSFYVLKNFPLVGGNDIFGSGGNGFINSFWGVIIPGASGSFAVFFMRQFFLTLPSDMLEMARIEGCREFRIFWRIYLPLTQPALATLGIFTFQAGWNSFLWPMIVLNDPAKATIQMGLRAFSYNYQTDFGPMMAGALVAIAPILVLFLFLQKYFVQGIAFSGVKG